MQEIVEKNKIGFFSMDEPEWEHVSENAKDFVRRAMSSNPLTRLTVTEALDHPWMAEYGGTMNYPPKFAKSKHHAKGCVVM